MEKLEFTNKEAFSFAIAFIKGNWILSLVSAFALLILTFFGMIPLAGFIFMLASTIFYTSFQIYVARVAKDSYFVEDVENRASQTTFKDFYLEFLPQSAGLTLGTFLLSMIFSVIFGGLLLDFITNGVLDTTTSLALGSATAIILWLSYIAPAVIGYSFMADDFKEAFYRSFNVLNPNFWGKTLTSRYFKFISGWSIIAFGLSFVAMLAFSTIFLIPVGLVIIYILILYSGIVFIYTQEKLK